MKGVTIHRGGGVVVRFYERYVNLPPIREGRGGGELMRETARRAGLAVFSRNRVPYPNIIHEIHTTFSSSNADTY